MAEGPCGLEIGNTAGGWNDWFRSTARFFSYQGMTRCGA